MTGLINDHMDAQQLKLHNVFSVVSDANVVIHPIVLPLRKLEEYKTSRVFNGYMAIDRAFQYKGDSQVNNLATLMKISFQSSIYGEDREKLQTRKDDLLTEFGCLDPTPVNRQLLSDQFVEVDDLVKSSTASLMDNYALTFKDDLLAWTNVHPPNIVFDKANDLEVCKEAAKQLKLYDIEVSMVYGMYWTAEELIKGFDQNQYNRFHDVVNDAYEKAIRLVHEKVVTFCNNHSGLENMYAVFKVNLEQIVDDFLVSLKAVSTVMYYMHHMIFFLKY